MKLTPRNSVDRSDLDATELTHLAVKAMRGGRDADALVLLERAIERDPADGSPHHLRGAIYASQSEFAKAIDAMTHAIELDPSLHGARFQLGLLHITSGNVQAARSVWQAFDELTEQHPFRLFKTGMLHLAKDEFDDCLTLLNKGIALCNIESVNNDMRRVITKVQAVVRAKPASAG